MMDLLVWGSPTMTVLAIAGLMLLLWEIDVRIKGWGLPMPRFWPPNLPILGHVLDGIYHARNNDILPHVHQAVKDYGWKTGAMRAFDQYWIIGSSPALVEHMFGAGFANYTKGTMIKTSFNDVLGNSIFTTDGAEWKEHRRMASHLFTAAQLQVRMKAVFERRAKQMVDVIHKLGEKGGAIDIQPLFYRFTFDTINEIAFGRAVDSQGGNKTDILFQEAFDRAQQHTAWRLLVPVGIWKFAQRLGLGGEPQMTKDIKRVNEYLADVITERIEGGEAEGDGQDLISIFLESCEKDGREPTNRELRDLIMSFVIAGRDTTASLLTWTFCLLAENKVAMDRVRQEIREKDGEYEAMHWTQAVLQESLRLYPSVPLEYKVAQAKDTLPCGTVVYPGMHVMYNPYHVLRNPSNFEDPDSFVPERWMNADGTCRKYDLQGFTYPAFNAGPRVCLGRNMAMLESKVVLSYLIDEFDFALEPGFVPRSKFTVVLAAETGMRMNVTPLSR